VVAVPPCWTDMARPSAIVEPGADRDRSQRRFDLRGGPVRPSSNTATALTRRAGAGMHVQERSVRIACILPMGGNQ
jgi:hypothetical protein